ncbi:hypothetical protein HDE_02514 [Halotydeus destructor]|nr:hypothetical protein HDE_02514 [Halotydeus destructor]
MAVAATLNSVRGQIHQRTVRNQLNLALKSVATQCLIEQRHRPALESIAINDLALSPLLSESSAFDVNISHVVVKNLNRYVVTHIELVLPEEETARFENVSWFKVQFKIPLVAISGHFFAQGLVGELFPVQGSGRLSALYKQVQIAAKIGLVEPEAINGSLRLAEGESLIAEDVTFEDLSLSVTHEMNGVVDVIDAGGSDRDGRASQVGTLLFWKVARQVADSLTAIFPKCLNKQFASITDLPPPRTVVANESRTKKRRNRRRL